MGVRVAVAGASGYAGGELLRIIAGHPDLEPGPLAAATSAGTPVTDSHPHLAQFADHAFEPLDPARLSSADLVFLALPHEESAAVSAAMPDGVPVVDLSASFRLADPRAWSAYYRTPHACQWCYGLPELPGARERIAGARRVASPGCYATAAILALAPLLAAGPAAPRRRRCWPPRSSARWRPTRPAARTGTRRRSSRRCARCWPGGATPLEPPGAPMAPGRQAGRPHRACWPGGATPLEPPGAPMAPGRQAGRPHRACWPGGATPLEPPGAPMAPGRQA